MWGLALLGVTLGRLGCSLYLLRAETQGRCGDLLPLN
jgi:hypothetical protein